MRDRSLWVHSILAVAASAVAYLAWAHPKITESQDNTVVVVADTGLTQIAWREEKHDVLVERGEGDAVKVSVTRHNRAPKKPAKKPANKPANKPNNGHEGDSSDKGSEALPKIYPGTAKAKELFEKLAPLKAAREIQVTDPEKRKAMGLDGSPSELTLRFGETERVIEVGNATFGSGNLYIRSGDDRVFLMPARTVSSLRHGASALLDRRLFAIERTEVERVLITAGAQSREFIQRHREDKDEAFFADPAEPDQKLEQASLWIDRLLRLRVTDVNGKDQSEPPALSVEFHKADQSVAAVKIWQPNGRTAAALTKRFPSNITVPKPAVDSLLKDLESVLSEN